MAKNTREVQINAQREPADWAAFQPATWEQLPDLGLYMDQVITYVEQQCRTLYAQEKFLTPAMVNNYVKSGLISRPNSKKIQPGFAGATDHDLYPEASPVTR
ncbi:MAG: DUF1836 domain-containing protein [Clostridiales bacterium]|nr:DUF1836 domain-containing protein [Clostridiales bacterium]